MCLLCCTDLCVSDSARLLRGVTLLSPCLSFTLRHLMVASLVFILIFATQLAVPCFGCLLSLCLKSFQLNLLVSGEIELVCLVVFRGSLVLGIDV